MAWSLEKLRWPIKGEMAAGHIRRNCGGHQRNCSGSSKELPSKDNARAIERVVVGHNRGQEDWVLVDCACLRWRSCSSVSVSYHLCKLDGDLAQIFHFSLKYSILFRLLAWDEIRYQFHQSWLSSTLSSRYLINFLKPFFFLDPLIYGWIWT